MKILPNLYHFLKHPLHMNKDFRKVLICGTALALSAGMFSSCNDDDDYETRISVLETAMVDLQSQLNRALTVGASVTNVEENNGAYKITLSDGQVIDITPGGGGAGGGSNVTVTVTDSEAIINVNGTEYKLPLGSTVNSLIYAPDYADGNVQINDNDGAVVSFLARPELSDISGATFTIAESHELKARVIGEENFKVTKAELADGLVKLTIICRNGELAGQTHAASVQMQYRGTVIGSNYFNIVVGESFTFESEVINPDITVKDASKNADGNYEYKVDATDLSSDGMDFAQLFQGDIPAGIEYRMAPASMQPGGDAQAKYALLAAALNKDGKFEFKERPGTSFNSNEEQKGFLVTMVKDEVIIAKTYVTINDPLANVNIRFDKDLQSQHMEYGVPKDDHSEGDPLHLHKGAQEVNFVEIMLKSQLALGHGSAWDFCAKFAEYSNDYVYATTTGLELTDDAKKYCKHSAGVRWFNVQTSVLSSQRRNWGMEEKELKEAAGGDCNGEIIGGWDGITADDFVDLGFSIREDGYIVTTDKFPGIGLRVGMGVELQYDYGTLPISDGCLAFLFFGRRSLDEGVKDVAAR